MKILVVDDQKTIRLTTVKMIEGEGHEADAVDGGQVCLLRLKEEQYDLVLLDMYLGDMDGLEVLGRIHKQNRELPVVVFTADASIEKAVEAMKQGAMDYLEKPFTPDHFRRVILHFNRLKKMQARLQNLEQELAQQGPQVRFDSTNQSMARALEVARKAAPTDASILLLGKSGTGKSVLAKFIHEHSLRRENPFVTISCPSLSRELLESELFGHVKGAYTGAVKDTWGKVDVARGGTLFLNEIGELPMELQPKLLRLLQERQFERVGEAKVRNANIRVVAATNNDLAALVENGQFREDLFYRLNVISVIMPPLKDRLSDLEKLAMRFLRHFSDQSGRHVEGFSGPAWKSLSSHSWPGNIRELRNVVERAVILARGSEVELTDLPDDFRSSQPLGETKLGDLVSLEGIERQHAERVIEKTESLEEAATVLGIDSATLYRKRKRWAASDLQEAEVR